MTEYSTGETTGTGFIEGATFGFKEVTYEIIEGEAIFEGDIVLGAPDEIPTQMPAPGELEAVVITGDQYRWPFGLVPYEIDSGLTNQKRVTDAIAHWQSKTDIRFVERTNANKSYLPNWVRFIPSANTCSSPVGMRGGQQVIKLAPGCSGGSTIHEIGHSMGLWHEQSREDRNCHVTINWSNIKDGKSHNFNQHIADGDDIGPYDYGSIMHYGRTAFSKTSAATIVPTKSGVTIGQRTGLSAGDVRAIDSIYPRWIRQPGRARDIGVGADGSVWVIGNTKVGGGYSIHRWNGCSWDRVAGGAVRIAVDPSGAPWVVNSSQRIYRRKGSGWEQMPGRARDIGVGADGSVWVIGNTKVGGGYSIHTWGGSSWSKVSGGAVRIAVQPNGVPWVVNSSRRIYRRKGSGWEQMPGRARDIGIGADGSVWVIGNSTTGGGYSIHKWTGAEWVRFAGGATNISVGPRGLPWVTNSDLRIYERKVEPRRIFDRKPGAARDVGVGPGGSVWVIGNTKVSGGYSIHRWKDCGWERIAGGAVRVAVGPAGKAWVVNSSQRIYRRKGSGWEQMPGRARDVGVGANGKVWVIGNTKVSGGYSIHRWTGSAWHRIAGGAIRIAVEPGGAPWVVNNGGNIYRREGNAWTRMPGAAKDIGIGADGSVWVIGTSQNSGGHGIYKWLGCRWQRVSGGATNISVKPNGEPWVTNSNLNIYERR